MKNIVFSAVIAVVVWTLWFHLGSPSPLAYIERHWEISLTMVFGSLIAGGTSEGGGAVAFPVFTKLLQIAPGEAKVFALAIQSVGMTAAALVIVYMGIRVEWSVIRWASLGGVLGMVLGSWWLAPVLSAPVLKMCFTAMITSFAVTLFVLNRREDRLCHDRLPWIGGREKLLLLGAGVVGGVMGGLVGNGIDIVTFSMMVLLFRVNEKVATPTSVILMAINALVGFGLHFFVIGGFNSEVESYWLAAMPVVVVGAPAGAMICSWLGRLTIVRVLLSLIVVELLSSLWLIPLTVEVVVSSLLTLLVFSGVYYGMYRTRVYELGSIRRVD